MIFLWEEGNQMKVCNLCEKDLDIKIQTELGSKTEGE